MEAIAGKEGATKETRVDLDGILITYICRYVGTYLIM